MKTLVCYNEESAVFDCPVNQAWQVFRDLDLCRILPSTVRECSLLIPPGEPRAVQNLASIEISGITYSKMPIQQGCSPFYCSSGVGSLRLVHYSDGMLLTFKVSELSDLDRSITFEVIHSGKAEGTAAMLHKISLSPVTSTHQTFLKWATEFSGDCDQNCCRDSSSRKLFAFKDIAMTLKSALSRSSGI